MAPLSHFCISGMSWPLSAMAQRRCLIVILLSAWLMPPAAVSASPGSWQEDASLRADGLLFRLRRKLEQNETAPSVKDERGERYVLETPGIAYSPADDNWSPAIPSTEEAPLFLARARGLLRNGGMASAAMEILLGLQTMDGRFYRTSEAARRSSAGASDLLHRLSVQRTDAVDILFRLDPYFVYDATAGETWLISDLGGFRAAIPGRWRMRRLPGFGSTAEHANRIVELTDGTYRITFVMDVWSGASRSLRGAEYLELIDMRRGLDRGRKESTGFSRTCSDGTCACTYLEKGARRNWVEFIKTRRGAAFFFSVSPSNERLLRAVRIGEGSARDGRSTPEDS